MGLLGESQGTEQGGPVIWKQEQPHVCSQEYYDSRPTATSMAGFQREEELREADRSYLFSGDWLCFLKAQLYTGTLQVLVQK